MTDPYIIARPDNALMLNAPCTKSSDQGVMSVAMFHTTLPQSGRRLGGVEITVHRLANALVDYAGCKVTVFSCGNQPNDAHYDHIRISSERIANGKLLRLTALPLQLNFIDFSAFDVLHLHGDDWFFFRRRLPTIRTLHGSALYEARFAQSIKRKVLQSIVYPLEHLSARLASRSVAVGEQAAALYRTEDLADNGVDTAVFKPGVKDEEPLLFYIGSWNDRKRGKFAFEIFVEQVLPIFPLARLYMACSDVPEHPSVIHGGYPTQEVLADWLARSWVFLYPSLYEGFGIPYIEALASGTAIVTSANTGADYVLEHGRYAVVATDADIGTAVCELLGNRKTREDLEMRGRRRAEDFSWQEVSKQHVKIYQKTIDAFETR